MISEDSLLKKKVSLTLGADRSTAFASVAFVTILVVFESLYLNAGLMLAIKAAGNNPDPVYSVVYGFYIFLSLYLLFAFTVVTIMSRWYVKVIMIVVFGIAVVTEYSYHNAIGRFTTFFDVLAAMSATPEQRTDSFAAYLSPVALVPIILLVSACSARREVRSQHFGPKAVAVFSIVYACFILNLSYVDRLLFDRQFHGPSFTAFGKTLADYAMYVPANKLGPPVREAVNVPSQIQSSPQNNIILVFDESIRADHLSLNGYRRNTTPYLQELERRGLLLNWGVAVSSSTSSHPSYNAFITGVTPDEYSDLDVREINSLPTIFQYARAMGYQTTLIDGQMKEYWGGTPDDLNYIDRFVSLSEIDSPDRIEDWERGKEITYVDLEQNGLKQWEIDEKIAGIVREIYSGSTGNFVFVYKRGAHFPYEKNYPESEAYWKPVYKFKEQWEIPPADKYDAIVNSYDNTLRFNLDDFFRKLAPDYSKLPNKTVIIYTSDHGESFFVNGRAGHGGDTPEEATVPLFVLGLDSMGIDTEYRASHNDLFGTMLDLFEYPSSLRKRSHLRSLLTATSADSRPRAFNIPTGRKIAFE